METIICNFGVLLPSLGLSEDPLRNHLSCRMDLFA